jgi:FkbM family methyltransferase
MKNYFTITYRGDSIRFPNVATYITNVIRNAGSFYEIDLLDHLRRYGPRGGLWIDVGANIGNHSVYFGKYTADSVLSIEPHPDTFEMLKATLEANGIRCNTVNCAAGAAEGTATLSLPAGLEDNSGSFTIMSGGSDAVEVRVRTLDDILRIATLPIRLIKIDVEGAEPSVLDGAQETISQHRPDIVVEAHTDELLNEVNKRLLPFGYRNIGRFAYSPTYHFARWSAVRFFAFRLKRKLRATLGWPGRCWPKRP